MTFQSILVQLDDTPASEQRVKIALRLAVRFAGTLNGYFVAQSSASMGQDQALLTAREIAENLPARETRNRVESQFRRIADTEGVTNIVLRMPENDVPDGIVIAARCADLVIVGQPDGGGDRTGLQRRLVESALLGGGAPLLVIPGGVRSDEIGTNIVVAWDGGREASRSVRDALPLLAAATQVSVVSIVEPSDAEPDGSHTHRELAAYFAAHRVNAQFKRLDAADVYPGDRLLSEAANAGADLIVMGGYTHPRLREWVLGGVTRRVLASMTVPVLMSH